MVRHIGPDKSHRREISLTKLADLFPDESTARAWFEAQRWPDGVYCPHCSSADVSAVIGGKPMPWRCHDCSRYFSVRTRTVMEQSKLPLRKWVFAIYLCATSLKGVSSIKLHRDLRITQHTARNLAHRLRKAIEAEGHMFSGSVEINETYAGKECKSLPSAKLNRLSGCGDASKVSSAVTRTYR